MIKHASSTKIIVHDYAGHPFQLDLSIELAKRGFTVYHIYTSSSGGPKAGFERDIDNLTIINFSLNENVNKTNFFKRFFQEKEYGEKLIHEISKINPDVIISANTPLVAQNKLCNWAKKNDKNFIFWLQDIISIAAKSILKQKIGLLGTLVSIYFTYLEKKILNSSNSIVCICKEFSSIVKEWGIQSRVKTIPNWAPIDEFPILEKNEQWINLNNLKNKFVCLYSGTMGMKHNPHIIRDASMDLLKYPDISFVVMSEGEGAKYLKKEKLDRNLNNLTILPFQKFSDLPKIFSSCDLLITVLEDDAGVFSVPSKLWSYYCSGKPNILSVPADNLTAIITKDINAGLVSHDKNISKLILTLKNDKELASKMGRNAREYAENNFKINYIADKFIELI